MYFLKFNESQPCRCRFECRKLIFLHQCDKILSVLKIKTNFKFFRTSAGKSTFRMQNDTDSANLRYTANKKYRSCHERKAYFNARASFAFPHLIQNILFPNTSSENCIFIVCFETGKWLISQLLLFSRLKTDGKSTIVTRRVEKNSVFHSQGTIDCQLFIFPTSKTNSQFCIL